MCATRMCCGMEYVHRMNSQENAYISILHCILCTFSLYLTNFVCCVVAFSMRSLLTGAFNWIEAWFEGCEWRRLGGQNEKERSYRRNGFAFILHKVLSMFRFWFFFLLFWHINKYISFHFEYVLKLMRR